MRLTRYDSIYQLTFFPSIFPVNCYLAEEKDGLTLIDAGLPVSKKGIMEAAKGLGKPIKRIVLTHAHGDHIGSLDALKQAIPGVKVLISERDSRLLKGDKSLLEDEAQTPVKGDIPKNIRTKPDQFLYDGDRVGSLLVIATPGHTPGSLSFFDEKNGVLIAGDAYHTRSGITVSGRLKLSFPFPALATWNKEEALKSAKKLLDIKPKVLATGHGNMAIDPLEGMKKAIGEAEASLNRKG
ncbi:metallo-beta-lactamase [Bacillus glycinifermentans]|uniref:MBL fold metallo-hydrolase n=1 Tax=Bacillus glycinifermentans TaxID=1664069 RepID=A0A0J6ES76_9BACI|nr:MBL fold metallo-hydrolase [Bacillus glycinifermentans]ATH91970.1 MBL fold hydrolase [Bacillus glycinifermentans]KMM60080.1 metallo-beta-lactamase [Bacillus glycinifermentans]KRT92931.1 MBL fold metallo-hydrolase [Bacillus glycinifermentans]MEC0486552.1 MBL fold metallo-hydrolase [Bacillus glycinifermentans]MEC0494887.1 MBL fold metallo-hydrolase [Bacillus glycinifermentans]